MINDNINILCKYRLHCREEDLDLVERLIGESAKSIEKFI